jgi:hypothetical protein
VLSIWTVPDDAGRCRTELVRWLAALPRYDWMQIAVAALVPYPKRSGLGNPVDLISSRSRSSGVALSAIASADVRREDEGTGVGLARLGMRGQA